MSKMNRRSFLKASLAMAGIVASYGLGKPVKAISKRSNAQLKAYGSGAYGQGIYSGYQRIFLPLIMRKKK